MTRLPQSARRIVAFVLAAWTGLLALGPIIHDGLSHDEDCAPALVLHDPSHHVIGAQPPLPLHGTEHCVVCHQFVGARHTPSRSNAVQAAMQSSLAARIDDGGQLAASTMLPLPARAPPISS